MRPRGDSPPKCVDDLARGASGGCAVYELRSQAPKGYVELRTPGGGVSLRIHHARIASARAIQLIRERGGFEVAEQTARQCGREAQP